MKIVDLFEADPYKGMKNVKGTVYLMHLDRPLAHSQHYIGWTNDVDKREIEHNSGKGSPYLRAAKEAGINFKVVRTWPNEDRHFERKLKNRKNARYLCPICRAEREAKTQLERPRAVNESSRAPLYHATRISHLANILYTNSLQGNTQQEIGDRNYQGISLTRSLDFAKNWGDWQHTSYAVLVLDQEKLKHNYEIFPVDFYTTTAQFIRDVPPAEKLKYRNFRRVDDRAESEEFLLTRFLKNLDQYLISILIPKATLERMLEEKKKYEQELQKQPKNNTAKSKIEDLDRILNNPKLKII